MSYMVAKAAWRTWCQATSHHTVATEKCSHAVTCAPSPPHRHLWQHVTNSLKEGNIDAATEHKHHLEERQRAEERQRVALAAQWKPKYFAKEVFLLPYFKDPVACFCVQEDVRDRSICLWFLPLTVVNYIFTRVWPLKKSNEFFHVHIVNQFTFLQLDLNLNFWYLMLGT